MKIINRTKYLGYYLSKLDWAQLNKFIKHVQDEKKMNKASIWIDVIGSVYKYNISIMDYFIFKFYNKSSNERSGWVGTGYKYEFDLRMNPKESRDVLENKIKFYETYAPFVKHAYCSLDDLKLHNDLANKVFDNPIGKIVVKDAVGQCGFEVEILDVKNYSISSLASYMELKGFNLAEEFVVQHPFIQKISPSGLNTVRVMTIINKDGEADIIAARLRISVNSHVDNLASGNIAASIDLKTGIVNGPGVYSDITKENVDFHPVSKEKLQGFQVPYWTEVMDISKRIALHQPQNRGVGWDIAITQSGPDFIEGNHNWCKILWQLPVGKGLLSELNLYTE